MNMTNEKAIDLLRRMQEPEPYEPQITEEAFEALELAIRVLGTDKYVGTADTISRQAALNEILGQPPELHYPSWYADQIRKLPPFRPEPNEETISKQDAIEELTEYGNGRTLYISVKEAVRRIKIIPPIKPRKGSWIWTGSGSLFDHYECSLCGGLPKWECMGNNRWKIAFTDFCPNCGAKMEATE